MAEVGLNGYVELEGLSELRKTLRRIDANVYSAGSSIGPDGFTKGPVRLNLAVTAFRDHLREAATIVSDEGRRRAPRHTGKLIGSIRPRVRGDTGLVVALAVKKSQMYPRGYRYPRRIEYEGSGGNRAGYGPRAFLGPALEAKADEVAKKMEGVLDAIADAWETNA
jgi:hypothetical protein